MTGRISAGPSSTTGARVTAWALWAVTFALSAAALVLAEIAPAPGGLVGGGYIGNDPVSSFDVPGIALLMFPIVLGTVGALIASRKRNNIGWLLAVAGVVFALASAAGAYTDYGLLDDRPGVIWAAWVATWIHLPQVAVMVVLFYAYPDGRLPRGSWRWAAGTALAGFLVVQLIWPFHHGPLNNELPLSGRNPLNPVGMSEGLSGPLEVLANTGWLVLLLAGGLGGVLALLFRYRGLSGERRYQIKWLAFAALIAMGLFVVSNVLGIPEANGLLDVPEAVSTAPENLAAVSLLAIPVAIGVALFKYRLYDIDVVISRTLVYTGLAVFIGAVYVAVVVGVDAVIGAGDQPNLVLSVAGTAVVAVAFQPVRERLTRWANRLVFGERATPYEVLSRFSAHLGETLATDETLERMARLLAEGTGASAAHVWLDIGDDLRAAAVWPPGSPPEDPEAIVEVVHEGDRLGALSLDKPRGEPLTGQDQRLMADLASQAGLLLRNVRLAEELRQKIDDLRESRQRLVAAQDGERRRLERDLHDGAQQQFVAVKLKAAMVRRMIEQRLGAEDPAVEVVAGLVQETDDGIQTLRELAHGIYPPLLEAEGLPAAIVSQGDKAPVPVTVEADDLSRQPEDVEAAIYFCVLEAINNAAKYAEPERVVVRLREENGRLTFEVSDDGAGYDPDETTPGHGLTNMADRLDALGGDLTVRSAPGQGTTVRGAIPVTGSKAQP